MGRLLKQSDYDQLLFYQDFSSTWPSSFLVHQEKLSFYCVHVKSPLWQLCPKLQCDHWCDWLWSMKFPNRSENHKKGFSNFYCRFLNPNNFFQIEFGVIQQLRGQNFAILTLLPRVDKNGRFLTPYHAHLVHVVIEWPLIIVLLY